MKKLPEQFSKLRQVQLAFESREIQHVEMRLAYHVLSMINEEGLLCVNNEVDRFIKVLKLKKSTNPEASWQEAFKLFDWCKEKEDLVQFIQFQRHISEDVKDFLI